MKKTFYYLAILCIFINIACSSEEQDQSLSNPEDEIISENENTITTPCEFNLNTLEAGDSVVIDCLMDLEGQTINLPADVTLEFGRGDIINGIINFENNGKIDGRLLNASLTLSGPVQLIDSTFDFYPERWNIVQGEVNDDIADQNRFIFKSVINTTKEYGMTVFKINRMDAFFRVDNIPSQTTPTEYAITIPSNVSLQMTDNTHLRIQPNNYNQPTLLSILIVDNVNISGGVLHGERDEHDYSDGGTHEWETLISIKGGTNITINNVIMMDSAGDGISVSALGHSFDSFYSPSTDVYIRNSTFIRNRRNQISLTDGRRLFVEDNRFIDASIHTEGSNGTAPGFAIDVEAVRGGNPAGPQQIAEDIYIRRNIEMGSRIGSFTVHTGDRVTIEENTVERFISYSTSIGTIVRNNTINGDNTTGTAIIAGRSDLFERNFDNKVYGNTITGYSNGIEATNIDLEVYENVITDCIGAIRIKDLKNSNIYNNTIRSTKESSGGILSHSGSKFIDNVSIYDNIIEVNNSGLTFINQNVEPDQSSYTFNAKNNDVKTSGAIVSNSIGFLLEDNILNERLRLVNAKNGIITNNNISSELDGIRIDSGCSNIEITNNTINYTRDCIRYNSTDSVNINESNNECVNTL